MTKNCPLVSVIIVNYNAGELLLNCVESLKKIDYPNYEIIIVDNISKDNSHNECKKKYPDIKLIQNQKNYGYCRGNNIGISKSIGEFVLVLNPDTIVEENLISELVKAFNQFGEGLYQPKILSLDNKEIIQSTGNMINIFGFGFARDKGKIDDDSIKNIVTVGYASGTCLFSSRNIFERLGNFDDFIFLYHDDLDLGWRASQIGIKSYYVPQTQIFHAESYSLKWSRQKFYWLERNRIYCVKTHYSKLTLKKINKELLGIECLVWIFYFSKGFFIEKIRANLDIQKNSKFLKYKQNEIENIKKIEDINLIGNFSEKIELPKNVSHGFHVKIVLKLINYLSKKAKNKIEKL